MDTGFLSGAVKMEFGDGCVALNILKTTELYTLTG